MKKIALIPLLLFILSAPAFADCSAPSGPIIPDGNVASQDELVAAQKAMKAYQDKLVGYRGCLDKEQAALDPEAEDTAEKSAEISAEYNTSVDAEAVMAEEFNVAVRAFKARQ